MYEKIGENEIILRQNEPSNEKFYIILSGKI